jgi:hypothetical protein
VLGLSLSPSEVEWRWVKRARRGISGLHLEHRYVDFQEPRAKLARHRRLLFDRWAELSPSIGISATEVLRSKHRQAGHGGPELVRQTLALIHVIPEDPSATPIDIAMEFSEAKRARVEFVFGDGYRAAVKKLSPILRGRSKDLERDAALLRAVEEC